jgi:hypothetical protein
MTGEQKLSSRRRRTRAEIQQLVSEFVNSGMRGSEFCRSRGLSFSTLDRHLRKQRPKKRKKRSAADGHLVRVELATRKMPAEHESECPLAVVLSGGRRIAVQCGFDVYTFERLVKVLERA